MCTHFKFLVIDGRHRQKRNRCNNLPHGPSGICIRQPSQTPSESSSDGENVSYRPPSSFVVPTQSTLTSAGLFQGQTSNGINYCNVGCAITNSKNYVSCDYINFVQVQILLQQQLQLSTHKSNKQFHLYNKPNLTDRQIVLR